MNGLRPIIIFIVVCDGSTQNYIKTDDTINQLIIDPATLINEETK